MNFNLESDSTYNLALTNLSIYDYIDLNLAEGYNDDTDEDAVYCDAIDSANLM